MASEKASKLAAKKTTDSNGEHGDENYWLPKLYALYARTKQIKHGLSDA